MRIGSAYGVAGLLIAWLFYCEDGLAQQASETEGAAKVDRSDASLGEIVVTARRKEESLQTVPVAVTVLGNQAIANAQIVDAADIQRVAPSVSIAAGGAPGSNFTFVSIRGEGTLNPGVAVDASVGTYVDGVYVPRPSQGITDLIDLQRIEVLRGPQGTLFGRNTIGGALSMVTENPTGNFFGAVSAQGGNYDSRRFQGILNVPLIGDELAMRFVYNYSYHDGFAENVTLGQRVENKLSHFGRVKLRWAPHGSDWKVTLSGDYNKIEDNGELTSLSGYLPTANPAISLAGNLSPYLHSPQNWYVGYGLPFSKEPPGRFGRNDPADNVRAYGASVTVEGPLGGGINLRSITGYRYSLGGGRNELDGTPVEILAADGWMQSSAYSEELQLLGSVGDRLDYIGGAYFSAELGQEYSLSQVFGFLQPPASPIFSINDGTMKNESAAVFGQLNYHLTDRLRATGGLRWTYDTRDIDMRNRKNYLAGICSTEIITNPNFSPPCNLRRSANFNYPAWTASLDFEATPDVFIYLKTSAAAKAGGFNVKQGSAQTPAFYPEKVKDVEFGAKSTAFDGKLRVNAALFYSWQTAVQRLGFGLVNNVITQYLHNAGDENVFGGEFEVAAKPWTGMEVSANLSLLSGYYKDRTFTEQRSIAGANLPGCAPAPGAPTRSLCAVDRSGEAVPQLPKTQFNISATQSFNTGIGELSVHANYAYIGSENFGQKSADPRESSAIHQAVATENSLNVVSGYGLFDGRIALLMDAKNLEIFAFGKNLADKKYIIRPYADLYTSLGVALEYVGVPRTWGIGARYRFGR
jgi:iron complex outermembrane receptor protein